MSLQKYRFHARKLGEPLRIPTSEERAEVARKRGGFDDSYIDKKGLKNLENVHRCFWCKSYLSPKAYNHRTGEILMACRTNNCPGNDDTSQATIKRDHPEFYARRIDKKLMFDLKDLLYGRDPKRMWAVKNRVW